jgi:hypothetical protein
MHKIRNFHEGQSTVGEWQGSGKVVWQGSGKVVAGSWQGNGTVCVNRPYIR